MTSNKIRHRWQWGLLFFRRFIARVEASMCVCVCLSVCLSVCLCTKCVNTNFSVVYWRIVLKPGWYVCVNMESGIYKYNVARSKVKVTGGQNVEFFQLTYLKCFLSNFSPNWKKDCIFRVLWFVVTFYVKVKRKKMSR